MTRYVPYVRTEEGEIERIDYAVFCSDEPMDEYVYKELLVGWPEAQVFWQKEKGASIGIAPIAPMDFKTAGENILTVN